MKIHLSASILFPFTFWILTKIISPGNQPEKHVYQECQINALLENCDSECPSYLSNEMMTQ